MKKEVLKIFGPGAGCVVTFPEMQKNKGRISGSSQRHYPPSLVLPISLFFLFTVINLHLTFILRPPCLTPQEEQKMIHQAVTHRIKFHAAEKQPLPQKARTPAPHPDIRGLCRFISLACWLAGVQTASPNNRPISSPVAYQRVPALRRIC